MKIKVPSDQLAHILSAVKKHKHLDDEEIAYGHGRFGIIYETYMEIIGFLETLIKAVKKWTGELA